MCEPGTRSMSPNEVKITPGRRAMACALSICSSGVTHTGQPGPCTSSISPGSRRSMPCLTIECVWPPQTSMSVHGRVVTRRDLAEDLGRHAPVAILVEVLHGSALGHFELAELTELLEEAVGPLGLLGVDLAEGEADVDEHVVAEAGLRQMLETDLAHGARRSRRAPSGARGPRRPRSPCPGWPGTSGVSSRGQTSRGHRRLPERQSAVVGGT